MQARASTLSQRLALGRPGGSPPARWVEALGGSENLVRRLRWAGHDRVPDVSPASVPAPWAGALQEILGSPPEDVDAPFAPMLGVPDLPDSPLLGPAARRSLRRHLARRLSEIATPALMEAFDGDFRAFVEAGLRPHLEEHPVLGRLLGEEVLRRREATRELLERLDRRVDTLEAGLGDAHRDGRCVMRVGDRYYKPRSLAREQAFFDLVGWLDLGLRTPRVWDGGWMEAVRPASCRTRAEVRRAWRRLGALAAVVHALVGSDCHPENLVMAGEHPVLVDLETFCGGRPADGFHPESARGRLLRLRADSVLATGLLSRPPAEATVETVLDANTDAMRFARVPLSESASVTLRGRRQRPEDHLSDLEAGFREAYEHLLRRRRGLLERLDAWLEAPTRFVFRPSHVYGKVLRQMLDPRHLADGLDQALPAERLALTFLNGWTTLPPDLWLREAEALERLDVPLFTVSPRERFPGMEQTGEERLRERLDRLGPEDLELQVDLLRLALGVVPPVRDLAAAASVGEGGPLWFTVEGHPPRLAITGEPAAWLQGRPLGGGSPRPMPVGDALRRLRLGSWKRLAERRSAGLEAEEPADDEWRGWLRERAELRRRIRAESDPEPLRAWRFRQERRCLSELGDGRSAAINHYPAAFELASGCSVGCWFCGFSAPRLTALAVWDPPSWRALLGELLAVLGPAARYSFLYWATDPLDHPRYEDFCREFHRVLGAWPRTTTALAARQPERARRLLAEARSAGCRMDRLSVLSVRDLETIHRTFPPEDLLDVELVLQPPGSDLVRASAGRARDAVLQGKRAARDFPDVPEMASTIACVSGFLVDVPRGRVRLISPCNADAQRPLGYRVFAEGSWGAPEEFGAALRRMLDPAVLQPALPERPLRLRPDLRREGRALASAHVRHLLAAGEAVRWEWPGREPPAPEPREVLAGESGEALDALLDRLEGAAVEAPWLAAEFELHFGQAPPVTWARLGGMYLDGLFEEL